MNRRTDRHFLVRLIMFLVIIGGILLACLIGLIILDAFGVIS